MPRGLMWTTLLQEQLQHNVCALGTHVLSIAVLPCSIVLPTVPQTSLLDFIRKTKVAAGEAGGITQVCTLFTEPAVLGRGFVHTTSSESV